MMAPLASKDRERKKKKKTTIEVAINNSSHDDTCFDNLNYCIGNKRHLLYVN
jgi:hypothetical protein